MKFLSLTFFIASAHTCSGAIATPGIELSSWMKQIPDNMLVSRIPILPGTHNSGTASSRGCSPFFCFARQQKLSIADQLKAGVRILDFRIRFDSQQGGIRGLFGRNHLDECPAILRIVHTFDTSYTLQQSLSEVKEFLDQNKGDKQEFVVILLRGDWPPTTSFSDDNCKEGRVAFLASLLKSSGIEFAGNIDKDITTVGDLRGKAVIVSQWFHEGVSSMETVPYVKWEDHYQVCDIWNDPSTEIATLKIDRFMQSTPVRNVGHQLSLIEEQQGIKEGSRPQICWHVPGTKTFTGVALDRTHGILPPGLTSTRWNKWFLENLETNKLWRPQLHPPVPVGVVLLDFADSETVGRLVKVGLKITRELALAEQP